MVSFEEKVQDVKAWLEEKYLKHCLFCRERLRKESRNRNSWICRNSWCKKRHSYFSATYLRDTKLKLESIIKILYMLFQNCRMKAITQMIDINKKTLKKFLKKTSKRVKKTYLRQIQKIGGFGIVVEVDESKFGKRKHNRGHRVEGTWVFGMVERTPERRIIILPVPDRKKNALKRIISRFVLPGSIIYSDLWRGYRGLCENYIHMTVNHSLGFVNRENGVHTNTIEGNWAAVKRDVPPSRRTKKRITLFLAIFMEKRTGDEISFLKKLL